MVSTVNSTLAPPPTRVGGERPSVRQFVVTTALVVGPAVALALVVPLLWGHAVHLRDIIMAVVFYVVTGYGISVGFHRLLTHRSFRASRALKICLALAGSLAVEGSATDWVANHRRHHMNSDGPGDPHSPHRFDGRPFGVLRGFLWAHVGWLFLADATSVERFAPDCAEDADLARISRLFPVLALVSLGLPFGLGWALSGTLGGAVTALVWAGLVRMAALHHVTWSVNSICHLVGRRPFATSDDSRNFAPLALLSFGESWHNLHHAHPALARHGALRGQLDPSATLIKLFEHLGWATRVRWPDRKRLSLEIG
ncbi:MAG: acyl-CoA desaturase [Acidimicrobiales bacterium]